MAYKVDLDASVPADPSWLGINTKKEYEQQQPLQLSRPSNVKSTHEGKTDLQEARACSAKKWASLSQS